MEVNPKLYIYKKVLFSQANAWKVKERSLRMYVFLRDVTFMYGIIEGRYVCMLSCYLWTGAS